MNVARSVAEVLSRHTTLTLECVDRMYLNVYVPLLQRGAGVAYFFRKIRGRPVPSSVLMAPLTPRFVEAIKRYAERNRIDLVSFRRGERKDERTQAYLRRWTRGEGVLYMGRAQEKARVLRTERHHDPATGATYPWLAPSTAMVNHFYFYAVDDDFGPFFLKFCSYFPFNAKLCINGHGGTPARGWRRSTTAAGRSTASACATSWRRGRISSARCGPSRRRPGLRHGCGSSARRRCRS